MRPLYLDYNATTPIAPSVNAAMQPFLTEHFGNPSSGHALGRACHEAIEGARGQVANLLGAQLEEIVFTSGGTESNNLALKGTFFGEPEAGKPAGSEVATDARLEHALLRGHLIISAMEHPAVSAPAAFLAKWGCSVSVIRPDRCGVVSPEAVEAAMRPDTLLVSIMHANNEIGTIQPLRDISDICRQRGVLLHTDAAQSVGKIRTNVQELDVDMLSLAGHKLYAPKGVGALYVRKGVALEPFLHGAGHESGLRAGTENVPYIVGMGKACALVAEGLDEATDRLAGLRDRLLLRLRQSIAGLTVNGEQAPRLPNTLRANFPGVSGQELLARIPELCASTGSACHSGDAQLSPTLAAIELPVAIAHGTVRLSVGWQTSEADVDRASDLLVEAWEAIR